MRRPHRRWHRRVWAVLPGVLLLLLATALVLRPTMPIGSGALVSGAEP